MAEDKLNVQSFETRQMCDDFKKELDLNLDSLYSQCNAEMGFQQSKRDQTIAFYIAIISFLVPAIMKMELNTALFSVVYAVLWLVGWMLSGVVRRYRIYKECYWLNLRALATLQRVKPDKLNKDAFQKVYAATMRLNCDNVVVAKEKRKSLDELTNEWLAKQTEDSYKELIDYRATWKKNSTSAEYLLYMLIVLISSLMMAMAVVYATMWVVSLAIPQWAGGLLLGIGLGAVAAALSIYKGASRYVRELVEVYAYCFDYREKSFNKPYTKAWFLHCFNSELEPEKKEEEMAVCGSK